MCSHNERLIRLETSVRKLRPLDPNNDLENAWWKGTLNGIKLALQQVLPDQEEGD